MVLRRYKEEGDCSYFIAFVLTKKDAFKYLLQNIYYLMLFF